MSVLDAFWTTWSNARETMGQGTPQAGAQFDSSSQLRQAQATVQSAAPGARWTGAAADAYAAANNKHARTLGRITELDQRLSAEVDRSAAVVTAGRQNLDTIKQWVSNAAASVPTGSDREQALALIARKGIGDVADVLKQTNSDLSGIGARIQTVGNEYRMLGGPKKSGGPADSDDHPCPQVQTVGNHGKLTPTQLADQENRAKLPGERARAQAEVDRLQPRVDKLARRLYMGDRSDEVVDGLAELTPRLQAAKKRVAEVDAIQDALSRAPETYLAQLDIPNEFDKPVHAAVAVGNPDTATNVSVTVPGVGSTVQDSLPGMVTEARNLQTTAQDQLRRLGQPGSVATIAWLGYDPPANPLNTESPTDLWHTMTDDRAQAGASSLASYLQQINANNPDAHLTVLGHSYGSLTSSLALQQLNSQGLHIVDDAVFYGSPGLEIKLVSDLGLPPGHVYVMAAPDDPITNFVAPTSELHGWGPDPYLMGLPQLSTYEGTSPDDAHRGGASGHADYPRATTGPDGKPVLNMAGYNLAVVVAGIADQPGGGEQLVMVPTPIQPYPHPGH